MQIGIKAKIVNHRFYQAILNAGYKTVAEFCKINKLYPTVIGNYVNLKNCPMSEKICNKLEAILCEPIHLMFPQELYEAVKAKKITKNSFYMNGEMQLDRLEDISQKQLLVDYKGELETHELQEEVQKALKTLTNIEQFVLTERFFSKKTLQEVGKEINCIAERVRQIEAHAIIKLRKSGKTKALSEFI